MDLTRNKRIRSGHINAFKRILDNSLKPIYRDYAEEKLIELKSLLDMLVAKYTKIVGIQDVIISLTDEDYIEDEIMDHTDFEEMAMKEINILKNFIDEKITKESEKIKNASSKQNEENIKLPKLELKKFNGDPLKWRTFADTFESAIHKNSNISNVGENELLGKLVSWDS